MRLNRPVAIIFALIFALAPLLGACQRQPRPGPQPSPVAGVANASPAAAQPTAAATAAPTLVPTPAPTRVPLPPVVVELTPAPGEEQPVSAPVVVTFDQAMDPASTGQAFSIDPQVAGTVKVEGKQLRFTPDAGFARAAVYQVRLAASAASASGLKLPQPVSFKVTTAGYLEVSGSQPADKAHNVAVDLPITVSFNRPVVPLTGVADQATLPQPLVITPTVTGKGAWISTSIYQFSPTNGLAASTQYSVTVKAGLTDTAGALLRSNYSFGFSTDHPTVTGWQPEVPNWGLKVEAPISATFSMAMDHTSTETAFKLIPSGVAGQPVTGSFQWNADSTVVGFTPGRPLDFGARYQASIDGSARAANGQGSLGSAVEFNFKTISLPAISSTDPREGNQKADPDGGIMFKFAAPMDPRSFISGTVTILPRPTEVYTNYNPWDNSFYVTFNKLAATPYTVTLAGSLADPYGNRLGKDYTLHFKTGDYAPMLDLANAGAMGAYNAYTATQAVVTYRNVPTVGFTLATLPIEEFLGLAAQHFSIDWNAYSPPKANLVRQWEVATHGAINVTGSLAAPLTGENGDELASGLYFLRASNVAVPGKGLAVQRFARTDLNITLKSTDSGALAWVTDLKSGQPVAGVKVRFTDGQALDQTAATGQDGVAQVDFPAKRQPWDTLVAIANAADGRFGFAMNDWENGISPWDFNLGSGEASTPLRGYAYTDRPIYRPGQIVYWKAILRRDNDALYSLPAPGQGVTVTINDDRGNKLYEQRLQLGATGTVDGKLALGQEASTGYYFLQAQIDKDNGFGVGFQVAEYRKPEYQISAQTDKPEYIQGEQIKVAVQAGYFFGGPVKNAKVHWNLSSTDYNFQYQPPRGQPTGYYNWNDWDWFDWERQRAFGASLGQGDGVTDDKGQFAVNVPADINKFNLSQRFIVDITLTDANHQAVSAQATAVVHKGAFYIGLQPQSYVAATGETNRVDVLTVDTQSRPVPNTAVTVVANRVTWYSVRQQAEDGNYYWNSQAQLTAVYTDTLTTRNDGTAVFTWTPDKGGEYKIVATGRDQGGRSVRSATFVWVSGQGYVNWRQENNDRIQLVADKDEYKVGDTARLLVASPFQGTTKALLAVERNHILSYKVIDISGNSQTLEIPIEAAHAPNVFVSLTIIKGMDRTSPAPSFKMGLAQLKVSVADKQLQVIATPDRSKVGPRETVTWDIQTLDVAGKPVANADVSLALVDKAVLSLAEDQSGTLMNRFYSQRAEGVRTATTLAVNIDRLVSQLNRGGKGGGGGGGGGEISVRSEFPDIAYWQATATTGGDGHAQVKVKLPDNLTTWTLDARAITNDTLVGQSKTDIIATKDLLVRPVLPRFLVQGDRPQIEAIVQNNTGQALDVNVDLAASGLIPVDTATARTATIAAQSNHTFAWPMTVQPGPGGPALLDSAAITLTARGGTLSDAVQLTLPVYHYTTPEVTGTSGQVEAGDSRLELVRLPAGADPTRGELDVSIEPSLAAGMTGGLTYLEHYPYECAEQTMSRFLPNVLTYQALKSLGISRPDLQEKLPQQVGVGLQKLYDGQHVDGGWGWWREDTSNQFITSYVVFGLAKAQKAGFSVDKAVLERGVRFVKQGLKAPAGLENWELNRQAFMVYALAVAGDSEPNRAGALFEARDRLSTYAKGYLALALAQINDDAAKDRIKTLLADIGGRAVVSGTAAHWEEGWTDFWNMNSDTRSTSVVVDVLATLDPANTLAPNAVRWLMVARQGDRWRTTQENAWAIMALTDWMVSTGELQGNYDWQVGLNGATLGQGSVTPQTVDKTTALRASVGQLLLEGTNSVTIERTVSSGQTGKGALYYTARLQSYLPVDKIAAQSRGVSVSRVYQSAACAGDTARTDIAQSRKLAQSAACPAVDHAGVGDVLNVKVSIVVPNSLYYLIVEDPLPAGLESIDTSLATTSKTAAGPSLQQGPAGEGEGQNAFTRPYWWWDPSHTDLRDEKTVMFATSLGPGSYEFNYQVRATLAGQFLTLPPVAYEMYFPEVQGRGAGSTFTITQP